MVEYEFASGLKEFIPLLTSSSQSGLKKSRVADLTPKEAISITADVLTILTAAESLGASRVARKGIGNIGDILPYLDYIWFGAFVSMVISSLIFSYNRKRENYFSLFTMSVLGLIIFIYVGTFIIQLIEWFNSEILLKVFPTLSTLTPIFNWYISNIGVINLVLISLCILANFVDLDFTKFVKRKEAESIDEI